MGLNVQLNVSGHSNKNIISRQRLFRLFPPPFGYTSWNFFFRALNGNKENIIIIIIYNSM